MAKLGNEVWDVQWLQDRIRALEAENADLKERMEVVLSAGPSTSLAVHVFDRAKKLEAKLKAAEEREADVRTLDENSRIRWACVDYRGPHGDPATRYRCEVGTQAAYEAPTPDEARAKAAARVRAEQAKKEPDATR